MLLGGSALFSGEVRSRTSEMGDAAERERREHADAEAHPREDAALEGGLVKVVGPLCEERGRRKRREGDGGAEGDSGRERTRGGGIAS